MSEKEKLIDDIDAILPQTQCGLCEYAACRPYAAAMVNNEAPIDRCLPGGVETLLKLADALEQDPTPSITTLEEKLNRPALLSFAKMNVSAARNVSKRVPPMQLSVLLN